MRMKPVKNGYIFAIPLSNGQYAFGQVIFTHKMLLRAFINIFDYISDEPQYVEGLEEKEIAIREYFCASFGIKDGSWPILKRPKDFDYKEHLQSKYMIYANEICALDDDLTTIRRGGITEEERQKYEVNMVSGSIEPYLEEIEKKLAEKGII